jgi:hypothetical protein
MLEPHRITLRLLDLEPFTLELPPSIPDDDVRAMAEQLEAEFAAIDRELPQLGLGPMEVVAEFERRLISAFDRFVAAVRLHALQAPRCARRH